MEIEILFFNVKLCDTSFHSSDRWILFGRWFCKLFLSCLSPWNMFYKHTEALCSSDSSVLGNLLAPWWFGWQDSKVSGSRSWRNTSMIAWVPSRALVDNNVVALKLHIGHLYVKGKGWTPRYKEIPNKQIVNSF